jgi:hypothetical protein
MIADPDVFVVLVPVGGRPQPVDALARVASSRNSRNLILESPRRCRDGTSRVGVM